MGCLGAPVSDGGRLDIPNAKLHPPGIVVQEMF